MLTDCKFTKSKSTGEINYFYISIAMIPITKTVCAFVFMIKTYNSL